MTDHIEKTTKRKRLGTLHYSDYTCKNHREKNRILKEINEMETDT